MFEEKIFVLKIIKYFTHFSDEALKHMVEKRFMCFNTICKQQIYQTKQGWYHAF